MTDLFESMEAVVNSIKDNMAALMEVVGELVTENTRLRMQSEELDEELANLSTYSTSKGTAQMKKEIKRLRAEIEVLREQKQQQEEEVDSPTPSTKTAVGNDDDEDDDTDKDLGDKLFVSLSSGEYYYEVSTRKLYTIGDTGTPGDVAGTMHVIELKRKGSDTGPKKSGKFYCDPVDDHVYASFPDDDAEHDGVPFDASSPVGILNKTKDGKTKLRFLTDESIYSRR